MANFYVKSGQATPIATATAYTTGTPGSRVVPTATETSSNAATARKWVWECTVGGTTSYSANALTWPASPVQDTEYDIGAGGGTRWTARKPGFSSGTTADWAYATAYITYGVSAAAAGDTVYVSSNHAASVASGMGYTSAGTLASPVYIFCVSDASTSPTSVTTGASETNTDLGVNFLGAIYANGISFTVGKSGVSASLAFCQQNSSNQHQVFENCTFTNLQSGSGTGVQAGSTTASTSCITHFRNCTFSGVGIRGFQNHTGWLIVEGGSITTAITGLVNAVTSAWRYAQTEISGFDLSSAAQGVDIVNSWNGKVVIRNCKLPSGWNGDLSASVPPAPSARVEMHNCDDTDTNWFLWVQEYSGSLISSTGVYRDGGASHTDSVGGTVNLSWLMSTTANCARCATSFRSVEFTKWNAATGSAKTVTVEICHDGASAFKDSDVWLEVMYLGGSGTPRGLWVSSAADPVSSGSTLTTSSAAWTGDSGTGPNGSTTWHTLKLVSPSFTPTEPGYIHARVVMGLASKAIYVDPVITIA